MNLQFGMWLSIGAGTSGVGVGASHGIGHVLGAACHVPHGHTSCVMLPSVLRWNLPANADRQKRVSEAFGKPDTPAADLVAEPGRDARPAGTPERGRGRQGPLPRDRREVDARPRRAQQSAADQGPGRGDGDPGTRGMSAHEPHEFFSRGWGLSRPTLTPDVGRRRYAKEWAAMPDIRLPESVVSNPRIGMTYVDADVNYLADLSIKPVTYNPPDGHRRAAARRQLQVLQGARAQCAALCEGPVARQAGLHPDAPRHPGARLLRRGRAEGGLLPRGRGAGEARDRRLEGRGVRSHRAHRRTRRRARLPRSR